ncbi:MAG: fdh2 [Planctomycetaceae bacterium]|nr:fdh2 [Planctomycetaceae bacterium]
MNALCWHGTGDVRVDNVPDPKIVDPDDAIIRITSTAICGSDLHLYDGYVPTMQEGDVLGHEPMGEVVEVGKNVRKIKPGDRVVIPFNISCGSCWFCERQLFAMCDNSNPNKKLCSSMMGQATGAFFGYSHMTGGFSGGQAEYLRVPYANVGPLKIESDLSDEKVLFLSDIFPTGYMAAEQCDIESGDFVAVWGCGPVGQFAIQSCWMLGAGRVVAIDRVPERLSLAHSWGKSETINFEKQNVYETLMEMTHGRGPDRCIDAVGAEAHGAGAIDAILDKAKSAMGLTTDRAHVLRESIMCCRKGGTLSIPGVYIGFPDKIPFGALMNKGLTIKTGQTHVAKYYNQLLKQIEEGRIDPSMVVTHTPRLSDAPEYYKTFRDKQDGCIKVVLKP